MTSDSLLDTTYDLGVLCAGCLLDVPDQSVRARDDGQDRFAWFVCDNCGHLTTITNRRAASALLVHPHVRVIVLDSDLERIAA